MKQWGPHSVKMGQKQAPLFYVLYDGITNSVFNGQVLEPLLKKIETNQSQQITLISFEQKNFSIADIAKIIPNNKITTIILKKVPYIGIISLLYAAQQLKKVLKHCAEYHLIARGPLAGMICRYIYNAKKCLSLTIQARGLMAQEYAYGMADISKKDRLKKSLFKFRMWQLSSIEKKAYNNANDHGSITIEAVSHALKEYLITTFNSEREAICVANTDIPTTITKEQCALWRKETRAELAIAVDAKVYCYNGSLKIWQCPDKVITFFKEKCAESPHSFLLVLTQDRADFQTLLMNHDVPKNKYHVIHVSHHEIYRYLAACDVGLLFREPHIVNWVSRPTKALEYQAVNLEVIHNNTVAWLVQN